MHPQGPAAFALLEGQGRQPRGLLAAPGLQQQGRLAGEVDTLLGR